MSVRQIITDVIAALELAHRLKHTPLLHDLLESSRDALEEALLHMDMPAPPPPTLVEPLPESPAVSVISSKRASTTYTDFIGQILPIIRRLHPSRNQKTNLTDAARLWKAHRDLKDPDEIFKAAQAQATTEAPRINSVAITLERLSRESD
jgi:hypothetical protein